MQKNSENEYEYPIVTQVQTPLVSIMMTTYNHESYIEKAIESVLMQETSFDFEIIIGEDCSTDNTRQIIRDYQEKFPDRFKVKFWEQNVGPKENFMALRNMCKGKYLCVLECDDYWGDPVKLQKQVEFLEASKDFVLCYHDSDVVDEDGKLVREHRYDVNRDWTKDEMIAGKGFATTNTALYRNVVVADEFRNFNVLNGDTLHWHLLGFHGKCKFLEGIKPSSYRLHSGGIWSLLDKRKQVKHLVETFLVIRQNINSRCENNVEILKLHDEVYINIFASFFKNAIKALSGSNYLYGLKLLFTHMGFRAVKIFLASHFKVFRNALKLKTENAYT